MIDLYKSKGMNEEDATTIITTMAKYKDVFINQMMVDELGMIVPGEDENPWFDGAVTFASFVFFGLFPLLGYLFTIGSNLSDIELFGVSIALTGVMLFVLGAIKSQFTTQSWWASGIEILLFGGLTATVSYLAGSNIDFCHPSNLPDGLLRPSSMSKVDAFPHHIIRGKGNVSSSTRK